MSSLFNSGQRPAIDAGLSVSRVGSAAQISAIKKVSSSLKLELAQFRELNAFSQFGSDLDKETKEVLEHGKKVMLMIKQPQHKPYSQEIEALFLFCIKEKIIKWIPEDNIEKFKQEILNHFNKDHSIILEINKTKDINEKIRTDLFSEMNLFLKKFIASIPNYPYEFSGI